jgi:hypothetical protein
MAAMKSMAHCTLRLETRACIAFHRLMGRPDPRWPCREGTAIYDLAKQKLALDGKDCVVVEDSRNGLLASLGAGMPTLITTSTYTKGEDFAGAARVVPELGDAPKVLVTLKDLKAIAAQRAA